MGFEVKGPGKSSVPPRWLLKRFGACLVENRALNSLEVLMSRAAMNFF